MPPGRFENRLVLLRVKVSAINLARGRQDAEGICHEHGDELAVVGLGENPVVTLNVVIQLAKARPLNVFGLRGMNI